MGIILDELLNEFKNSELDQQVKQLCDRIMDDEKPLIKNEEYMPIGPNIFIAISCPGRTKQEIAFLTLEREFENKYIIGFWAIIPHLIEKGDKLKRYIAWDINENTCKQIIKSFAQKLKYIRGDI